MSFLWARPPLLIGHRGNPSEAPENTLASFRAAQAAGLAAVELDARLSADGEVVVHHDALLGRTVDGSGPVEDLPLAALRRLDAGSWFGPAFRGERVPTLRSVLEAFPRLLVNVELKADGRSAEALPARVLDVVAGAGALDRVLVTSFEPALARAYGEASGRPAGAIHAFPWEETDLAAWEGLGFVAMHHEALDDAALAGLRRAGKTVLAWTVNDEAEATRLLAKSAPILTDRPARMARLPGASAR